MREFNDKLLTKKFDNTRLYILGDILTEMHSVFINDNHISHKTKRLFDELYYSVHDDIGHLKCDKYTDIYIVKEGHNFK